VTALGDLHGRRPVTRGGARPGDVVVVAGRLGGSSAGLVRLLAAPPGGGSGRLAGDPLAGDPLAGDPLAGDPLAGDPLASDPLVGAHRRPQPPYALGPVLCDAGATSMCDVSDGLVVDLLSLCDASGVGVLLDVAALPAEPGASDQDVLHGGEDHALLATVPPAAVDALAALGVRAVGRVREGGGVTDLTGTPLTPRSWEHFA